MAAPTFSHNKAGDGMLVMFTMLPPSRESVQEMTVTINWGGPLIKVMSLPSAPHQIVDTRVPVKPPVDPSQAQTIDQYIAALSATIPDFQERVERVKRGPARPSAASRQDEVVPYEIARDSGSVVEIFTVVRLTRLRIGQLLFGLRP